MATQVILTEKVENLGSIGEIVNVKPGFARNYLIPQNKAMRATKENVAYFESIKKNLEDANAKKQKDAESTAKKIDGKTATLVRMASEAGHLYGGVNSRDIADAVKEATGVEIARNQIDMNRTYKTIGLFPVEIALHADVKPVITVNIARTEEEAATQAKTGRALVAGAEEEPKEAPAEEAVEETAEAASEETPAEETAEEEKAAE